MILRGAMFDPREAIAAHIDKSFTQAERGELIDGDAVEVLRQRRVERMKPRGRPPRFSHLVVSPRITAMLPTAWKGGPSRLAAPGAASSDGDQAAGHYASGSALLDAAEAF
jgi:hypothetical protein